MKTLLQGAVFAVAALFLFAATPAQATPITFNVFWSGAFYGNTASASGFVTIESTGLPNPGGTSDYSFVVDVSITVSGASSGNGTFNRADFTLWDWGTNGATLDLTRELVGQPTNGNPWGTHAPPTIFPNSGDFNLFGTGGAPQGTWYFLLTTNNGAGDRIVLTSMTPSVPEPAVLTMLAVGGVGLFGLVWYENSNART